jgi:hypothetical protein
MEMTTRKNVTSFSLISLLLEHRGRFNYCMKREAGPRLDYMRVCTTHFNKPSSFFAGSSNWSFARALEAIDTQYLGDNIFFFQKKKKSLVFSFTSISK